MPAEDVVVLVHFPDQLYFPSEEELVELEVFCKKRPKPPARPKIFVSPFDGLAGISRGSLLSPPTAFPVDIPDIEGPSNIRGPFIRHKDSTEVRYEMTKLMHGFEIDFDPAEFFVSEDAVGHVWKLEFSIHVGNLPKNVMGTLLLEIQYSEAV